MNTKNNLSPVSKLNESTPLKDHFKTIEQSNNIQTLKSKKRKRKKRNSKKTKFPSIQLQPRH